MKITDGYFVLYQPKYRIPSVFDLHERSLFRTCPFITKDYGFRLIVNEEFQVKMQYMHLIKRNTVDENKGEKYYYVNDEIVMDLKKGLTLNLKKLKENVPDKNIRDEIIKLHREWYASYVPSDQDGKVDRSELEKKLTASINKRRQIIRKELVRKNNPWIEAVLPRRMQIFKRGLYLRVADRLYDVYRENSGEDAEKGLIKKIQQFHRIYENDGHDVLLKPNGSRWKDDDEIWECWLAFAGTEGEAKRICRTMEAVFRPLAKEMAGPAAA
jgi:hypothetical protein